MKKISLTKGKFAIVDNEDYPYLNRFNWIINEGRVRRSDVKVISLTMPSMLIKGKYCCEIMHINNNRLDCRKKNLKVVGHSIVTNKSKHKSNAIYSKYKGVTKNQPNSKKWRAYCGSNEIVIGENGKRKYKRIDLGYFDKEKDAAIAYNEKVRELYGEFAYQNKI